ncbi:hypothetical protein ACS8FD_03910 [Psychrobacter sp. 1U2]|uniref:hypothetical protein n=1 Tax=Psychrobacter sp. 1U2 TaxID=3453577 RepID=UPI003F44C5D5
MTEPLITTLTTTTAVVLLAYIVLWSWLQTFNANPTKRFVAIWLKLILYYAAYTMPFWAVLTVVGWTYGLTPKLMGLTTSAVLFILVAMGLYFYTVVVQPNRLRLHHQEIDLSLDKPLTVAVLADLRIGLYSGKPRHIRKLITTINELSVDAVLITGDWLYYPGADLVGQMMLFKGVNKPIYTVMSISDLRYQSMNTTKQGKPLLEDTLASAFDVLDVTYIGQQCWPLPTQSTTLDQKQRTVGAEASLAMLCGWQDLPNQATKQASAEVNKMQEVATETEVPLDCYHKVKKHDATRLLDDKIPSKTEMSKKQLSQEVIVTANKAELCEEIRRAQQPVVILASRFDSITDLPNGLQPRPLLIAGAAKKAKSQALTREQRRSAATDENSQTVFSTFNNKFSKRGLYQHGSAQVFVSSGIGTRGLPFRLYRPTIDVLTIR